MGELKKLKRKFSLSLITKNRSHRGGLHSPLRNSILIYIPQVVFFLPTSTWPRDLGPPEVKMYWEKYLAIYFYRVVF